MHTEYQGPRFSNTLHILNAMFAKFQHHSSMNWMTPFSHVGHEILCVCFGPLQSVLNLHLLGSCNFKTYDTALNLGELHLSEIIGF
jgi:hypothetical protein